MQKTKRREWVKTFAIIFLVILLILTFFSNTIMNRSLPEVAAQYVESGTINAKIRGTGTVSADETYDVTINQTRKIRSVMVKVGDTVSAGDTLFVLEAADSEELKTAQQELSDMELAYQKSLIEAGNTSATENRDVQKLRDAYNEALATLRLYSNSDPTQITAALEQAKVDLTYLQRTATDAETELTNFNAETTELQNRVTEITTEITELETEATNAVKLYDSLDAAQSSLDRDKLLYQSKYDELYNLAGRDEAVMAAYSKDFTFFQSEHSDYSQEQWQSLAEAYIALTEVMGEVTAAQSEVYKSYPELEGYDVSSQLNKLERKIDNARDGVNDLKREQEDLDVEMKQRGDKADRMQDDVTEAKRAAEDKQAEVDKLTAASTAAEAVKTAQTALEDKVFEASLGDSASLDIQNSKKAIEAKQKQVEELMANADGQEVKANVSGKISAINVTAGNNAGADTALATITVADRGYTLSIPVTADQAKQVTVGDVATITNYYSDDITATLESVANDPQNPGQGKMLVFRLTGDGVEAGANLTLSIGQRSANYDCLIPNSALRNDSNGDFVLVVVAKSTPLGNRYVATRASVTVLAKDDTKAAVTGLASGDFVITTSSAPIEAGSQVRLVDNG